MKEYLGKIFPLSIILFCFTACENEVAESKVPSIVVNTFKSNYPDANDVEWVKDYNFYEIDFEVNNNDHSVRINRKGQIIKKKNDITVNELPVKVRETIKRNENNRLDDLEIVEEDGNQYYQVEYADDRKIFDENGSVTYSFQYWE